MDTNEISFDAIVHNPEFKRCQFPENITAAEIFHEFLNDNIEDHSLRDKIESAAVAYVTASENAAFEQGFSFAVKMIKFINRAG